MQMLVVESDIGRAAQLRSLLKSAGWLVHLAATAKQAIEILDAAPIRVIVLDLELSGGGALSVPIYAGYRQPDAKVIVLTGSTVFNDGSIFDLCANACAFLNAASPPSDIVALVDYHGNRRKEPLSRTASSAHAVQ